MSSSTVLGIAGALIIMVTLFEMLRRRYLREKYALVWFVIAVTALVTAAFPSLLTAVSSALGVQVPSNLVFFSASIVLFLMSLQHSSELGRLEERTRTLAEEVAVLRLEISNLEDRDRNSDPVPRPGDSSADDGA